MKTDRDARNYLATALTTHGGDFNTETLLQALRAEADGWDFDSIPTDRFWEIVAEHDRSDQIASEYTVQIDVAGKAGIWQSITPAESVTADDAAGLETAAAVARWVASNQTVADGRYRVQVWVGVNADTSTDPAAEHVEG